MVSNYRRGGEFCCLRRWWMAGNVRPALQTPDNYKCQAAHRAAGSQQPRTALHCKTEDEDCAPAVQRRPQEAEQQQAVDLSPRGGIGKGADDGLAAVT